MNESTNVGDGTASSAEYDGRTVRDVTRKEGAMSVEKEKNCMRMRVLLLFGDEEERMSRSAHCDAC